MNQSLFKACCNDSSDDLKRILNDDSVTESHINSINDPGVTPLIIACHYKKIDHIRLLLEDERTDLNIITTAIYEHHINPKHTAFTYAVCINAIEFVKLFLDNPVDINILDSLAIRIACDKGYHEIVKLLLDEPRLLLSGTDDSGTTALMNACRNGHVKIVQLLLDDPRIDLHMLDTSNRSALFYTVVQIFGVTRYLFGKTSHKNRFELFKLLLNSSKFDLNAVDKFGRTIFICACSDGNYNVVKLLLECSNIDFNKRDTNGRTAFYHACYRCQSKYSLKIIRLLLDEPDIDVNMPDNNGVTPICAAVREKDCYDNLVKMLLNNSRIDIHKRDNNNNSIFGHMLGNSINRVKLLSQHLSLNDLINDVSITTDIKDDDYGYDYDE